MPTPRENAEIFDLSDALVDAIATHSPIHATFMGVAGHDDRWDDLSPEGDAERAAMFDAFAARADALPPPTDADGSLALAVLHDALALERDALAHHDGAVDLNILASPPQLIAMALDTMDTASPAGHIAAAARLRAVSDALAGYQRNLAAGLERGQRVAARQVRAVAAQARVHAGASSALRALGARIDAVEAGDAAAAAYGAFAEWLEDAYLPHASDVDAVGPERYAHTCPEVR